MKVTKQAQTSAQSEAQTSAQSEVVLETMQAQLEALESVLITPIKDILALPIAERVIMLNKRKQALEIQAKLTPINDNSSFESTGLKGSDILGGLVFKRNSIENDFCNTVELWRKCESNGILEVGAFIRSWNTSLAKYERNKEANLIEYAKIQKLSGTAKSEALTYFYNGEIKYRTKAVLEAQINKRLPETVPYFDNINITIQGLKGKATQNKRFQYFFESLLNDKGVVPQNINLMCETVSLQGVDVPFNSMNEILVYNNSEADKSIEIFKAWLLYKGGTESEIEQL